MCIYTCASIVFTILPYLGISTGWPKGPINPCTIITICQKGHFPVFGVFRGLNDVQKGSKRGYFTPKSRGTSLVRAREGIYKRVLDPRIPGSGTRDHHLQTTRDLRPQIRPLRRQIPRSQDPRIPETQRYDLHSWYARCHASSRASCSTT